MTGYRFLLATYSKYTKNHSFTIQLKIQVRNVYLFNATYHITSIRQLHVHFSSNFSLLPHRQLNSAEFCFHIGQHMIDIFDVAVAILAPFLLPRVVSVLFFFPSVSSFLIYLFCYAVVMGGIPRWPTGPCLDIDEFASPPVPSETHRRLEEASKRSITQDEIEKEYTRIM